ncbi:MAG: cadmium-translocating P-type ATPase [Marinilabiliales bacterium]|nr:MAG: cadmium-translocating P-type ATPase [Marinilabiliales bacterium]
MGSFKQYFPALFSALLVSAGIAFSVLDAEFFSEQVQIFWYALAYLPVGAPVVVRAVRELLRLDFANEFFLMSVATIGAFAIGEYAEAVAVMLFYEVGELFQANAVNRARGNIKALLDLRPDRATVRRDGDWLTVKPDDVAKGEIIMVRPGEKVPLDGELTTEGATLNTAALTGESRPDRIRRGDKVLAGSVNLDGVIEVITTRVFADSSLSRILALVEEAGHRKAPTERFMRRFARYYTPLVMAMALLITFFPLLIVEEYVFANWVYRAFVFLVIACPCALYISIPLGYFGGIGAASKNGILFKGADFLDRMKDLHTLIIDKTGTLTKGNFRVTRVEVYDADRDELVRLTAALESRSNHPVARAIVEYSGNGFSGTEVEDVKEIPAHGMTGKIEGREVIAGNGKLMDMHSVKIPPEAASIPFTCVHVAVDGKYLGYFVIADEVREDSGAAVTNLHKLGVKEIVVLSGDRDNITREIAGKLGIDHAHGDLLPEEKTAIVREYLDRKAGVVAFAGDGINDAPSIALADVGIAMGAMGSDLAIETADVVIQTDQPSKIARAVQISRATSRIVWQNIWMVFVVKAVFLGLGAMGLAGMWEAVFADMGVALAAIFNAIRIQRKMV